LEGEVQCEVSLPNVLAITLPFLPMGVSGQLYWIHQTLLNPKTDSKKGYASASNHLWHSLL